MNYVWHGIYIFCMGFNLLVVAADDGTTILEFNPQQAEGRVFAGNVRRLSHIQTMKLFKPIPIPPGARDNTPTSGGGSEYSSDGSLKEQDIVLTFKPQAAISKMLLTRQRKMTETGNPAEFTLVAAGNQMRHRAWTK